MDQISNPNSWWFDSSTITWLLLCTTLTVFVYYNTRYRGFFEKYGIPVPPAWPIINHFPKFWYGEEAPLDEWFKKYGDTFGTYGMYPQGRVLVTKNLEIIKQILVKDFANFANRFFPKVPKGSLTNAMFLSKDDDWRRLRRVGTPMFTSGKLRAMLPHVNKSAQNLKKLIRLYLSKGEVIPVKFLCGQFTSEVIARVGFGMESHAVSTTESEFGYYARTFLRIGQKLQWWFDLFSQYVPQVFFITRRIVGIDIVVEEADSYFVRVLKEEISRRRKERAASGQQQFQTKDMLDVFLDAEVPEGNPELKEPNAKALTEKEIIDTEVNFIVASFETITSVLQAFFYYIAQNPDIQDKIVEEVDSVVSHEGDVEYDQIAHLSYTEQVLNECMRLQPPQTVLFRTSLETKTYDGITIPGRTDIYIPIDRILKDPSIWGENPEKIDPDHFSPENREARNPYAFAPFGLGPRHCIGQRLAMMELKLVIAVLLKEFRFEQSARTEPVKGKEAKMIRYDISFTRPEKDVTVEALFRN